MGQVQVLVTGHTGFIGRAFTRSLDRRGLSWHGISRSSGVDLGTGAGVDTLPAADWVVHLAGVSGVRASWDDPARFHRVNHALTVNALDLARRHGARFLFVSSYMYGVPKRLPIDEEHPLAWNNPYAASKRVCEVLCTTFADNFGLPMVIARPFNLFGPGQSPEFLIPYVVQQALQGESIVVDDLAPRRDYLWVEDLAEALTAVVCASQPALGVFNIGRGRSHSVGDVIAAVVGHMGPRQVLCRDDIRPNEIPDCIADSRKFRAAYDWQPVVSLEEGVARMLDTAITPSGPPAPEPPRRSR